MFSALTLYFNLFCVQLLVIFVLYHLFKQRHFVVITYLSYLFKFLLQVREVMHLAVQCSELRLHNKWVRGRLHEPGWAASPGQYADLGYEKVLFTWTGVVCDAKHFWRNSVGWEAGQKTGAALPLKSLILNSISALYCFIT